MDSEDGQDTSRSADICITAGPSNIDFIGSFNTAVVVRAQGDRESETAKIKCFYEKQ